MTTVDRLELETTPEMAQEADRWSRDEERNGNAGKAAKLRLFAARLRCLYNIVLEVSTDEGDHHG